MDLEQGEAPRQEVQVVVQQQQQQEDGRPPPPPAAADSIQGKL